MAEIKIGSKVVHTSGFTGLVTRIEQNGEVAFIIGSTPSVIVGWTYITAQSMSGTGRALDDRESEWKLVG